MMYNVVGLFAETFITVTSFVVAVHADGHGHGSKACHVPKLVTVKLTLVEAADVDRARKQHLERRGCVAQRQVLDESKVPVDPGTLLRRIPLRHALDRVSCGAAVNADRGVVQRCIEQVNELQGISAFSVAAL